jgi:hypothetical protein
MHNKQLNIEIPIHPIRATINAKDLSSPQGSAKFMSIDSLNKKKSPKKKERSKTVIFAYCEKLSIDLLKKESKLSANSSR